MKYGMQQSIFSLPVTVPDATSGLIIYIYIYIYIYNTAVHIKICRFLINVAKFTQTLTKFDLPTLRKGSIEERTQRNK